MVAADRGFASPTEAASVRVSEIVRHADLAFRQSIIDLRNLKIAGAQDVVRRVVSHRAVFLRHRPMSFCFLGVVHQPLLLLGTARRRSKSGFVDLSQGQGTTSLPGDEWGRRTSEPEAPQRVESMPPDPLFATEETEGLAASARALLMPRPFVGSQIVAGTAHLRPMPRSG